MNNRPESSRYLEGSGWRMVGNGYYYDVLTRRNFVEYLAVDAQRIRDLCKLKCPDWDLQVASDYYHLINDLLPRKARLSGWKFHSRFNLERVILDAVFKAPFELRITNAYDAAYQLSKGAACKAIAIGERLIGEGQLYLEELIRDSSYLRRQKKR